jgi:hypothetical protein
MFQIKVVVINEVYFTVVNPGLEVGLCRNALLLNPTNNRTTMLKYFNNNMPLLCYISFTFSGLVAHYYPDWSIHLQYFTLQTNFLYEKPYLRTFLHWI